MEREYLIMGKGKYTICGREFSNFKEISEYYGISVSTVSKVLKNSNTDEDFITQIEKVQEITRFRNSIKEELESKSYWREAFGETFESLEDLANRCNIKVEAVKDNIRRSSSIEELEKLLLNGAKYSNCKKSITLFGVSYSSHSDAEKGLGLAVGTLKERSKYYNRGNFDVSFEKYVEEYICERSLQGVIWKKSFGRTWEKMSDIAKEFDISLSGVSRLAKDSSTTSEFEESIKKAVSKKNSGIKVLGKHYKSQAEVCNDLQIGITLLRNCLQKTNGVYGEELDRILSERLNVAEKRKVCFNLFGKRYSSKSKVMKEFSLDFATLENFLSESKGNDKKLEELISTHVKSRVIKGGEVYGIYFKSYNDAYKSLGLNVRLGASIRSSSKKKGVTFESCLEKRYYVNVDNFKENVKNGNCALAVLSLKEETKVVTREKNFAVYYKGVKYTTKNSLGEALNIPFLHLSPLLKKFKGSVEDDVLAETIVDYWEKEGLSHVIKSLLSSVPDILKVSYRYNYNDMNYYIVFYKNGDICYMSNKELIGMCKFY